MPAAAAPIGRARPSDQPRRRPARTVRPPPRRSPGAARAVTVDPAAPVTPSVSRHSEGSPASAWQSRASAERESGTITWNRPASGQGCSTTTPAAPRSKPGPRRRARRTARRAPRRRPGPGRAGGCRPCSPRPRNPRPQESSLGQQPPQTDRRDPLLGGSVVEPACHRRAPPCLACLPSVSGAGTVGPAVHPWWAGSGWPHTPRDHPLAGHGSRCERGGGILGQGPKKGNASLPSKPM